MLRRILYLLPFLAACAPTSVVPTDAANDVAFVDPTDATPISRPDVARSDAPTSTPDVPALVDVSTVDTSSCGAAGAHCATGADCCSGACETGGTCWQGTPTACADDGSCPSGMVCQPCDHQCVYPPNAACDTRAPCPCDFACVGATCVATTPSTENCTYDRDCPVNEFCNRAVFQCQYPMWTFGAAGAACTRNADCPASQICGTPTGTMACYAYVMNACRATSDCPSGQFCSGLHQCTRHGC